MATIASLIVQIAADTSTLVRNVDESTRKLDELSEHAIGTIAAGSALGDALEHAGEQILHTAVQAVKELAEELEHLVIQGSHVSDVEAGFEHLTDQAGLLGTQLLGTLRAGTHGTVDDFALMKRANQDLAAGLDLTEAQFGLLAQGSFALSKTLNVDVKTALDTMSDAMVTGKAKALALLTGKVDLKKAEEDFATGLHKTTDQLNAEGKLEADREAILHAVGAALARVGAQHETLADHIAQSRTWWANFEDELAKTVATSPVIIGAFNGIKQILIDTFGTDRQTMVKTLGGAIDQVAIVAVDFGIAGAKAANVIVTAWDAIKTVVLGVETAVIGTVTGIGEVLLRADQLAGKVHLVPPDEYKQIEETQIQLRAMTVALAAETAEAARGVVGNSALHQTIDKVGGSLFALRDNLVAASTAHGSAAEAVNKEADAHNAAAGAAKQHGAWTQEAASEIKKFNEALAELDSVGQGWYGTLLTIDGETVDAIKYYLDAGVAQDKLATAYGLTAAQVKAVVEAHKAEQTALTETTKLWEEFDTLRVEHGGTATDKAIAEIYKWRDSVTLAMQKAGADTNEFYDALEAVTAEKLNGVMVNWGELRKISRDTLHEQAAIAQATYDEALQHSGQYTAGAIEHLHQVADQARRSADAFGSAWDGTLSKTEQEMNDLAAAAVTTFATVGHGADAGQQKIDALSGGVQRATGTFEAFHGVIVATAHAMEMLTSAAGATSTIENQVKVMQAQFERGGFFNTAGAFSGGLPRFDVGGPITHDGPIFAHADEFVVPKGGTLVRGSGSGSSVTFGPGAVVINYPVMNDPRAKDEIARLVGDALITRLRHSGLRVPSGA